MFAFTVFDYNFNSLTSWPSNWMWSDCNSAM